MDFSFSENQNLIADSAHAFLTDRSASSAVRAMMATAEGFDIALWHQITQQMGWHLTHIPEALGGLGMGYVELCILLERMGYHLLCAPFFSTVCLGVNALLVAATPEQRAATLKQTADTGKSYALAYTGQGRRWGVDSISGNYELVQDGAMLNGTYNYVIDGHTADRLIVAARKTGTHAEHGLALFMTDADAPGISRRWTPGMDQTRKLAEVTFDNVEIAADNILQKEAGSGDYCNQILALACIALAAEQVGVAEKSMALAVAYISERKQFGRAVGSFQAMKHKAADMLMRVEAARSAVYYAACIADEFLQQAPLGKELIEAASIAKAYCCDAAFFNAGTALQMHGGAGFTWEYDIQLYFKRAKAAQVSFGDSAWHKERLAQMILGDTG